MKLVSYESANTASFGVVKDDGIVDLASRLGPEFPTLASLLAEPLERVRVIADSTRPDIALAEVTMQPVIPNPSKILLAAVNYADHLEETKRDPTEKPVLFIRLADSQTAHMQPIVRPSVSDRLDYEGELAIVIGKPGRHISEPTAMLHVAGYSCYNDATVRDWQRHTSQFTPGKNFASTGAFGPWLVTSDEIADPFDLDLCTRLNGEELQRTNTSLMIHSMPKLIAYISTFTPLFAGDVIVTGTCGGVGVARTPPIFLKPGDTVEVEISGVGKLINPVEQEHAEID